MERLKELRLRSGLTQKQLAELLDMDRTSIVKYETGKNGPTSDVMEKLADIFGVSVDYLLGREEVPNGPPAPSMPGSKWIPVLGNVAAGVPIETVVDIIDYEEISPEMATSGDYFGLTVKGDSMEPVLFDGDIVIVRVQEDCETGDTAVIQVNGHEATVKKIKKRPEGVILIPHNSKYEPMLYSNDDILSLPVSILGKVVELRRKF